MTKKQSIWIVRYGLTKFPLVENEGPYDSELDPDGVEAAKCIAQRIIQDASNNEDDVVPKFVYASPFVRTTHTAQLIALDLPGGAVRIEGGLTEWQIPSLLVDNRSGVRTYPKGQDQLAEVYGTIDLSYKSVNPPVADDDDNDNDDNDTAPKGAPKFEESEHALLLRCATTLEQILTTVEPHKTKGESLVMVSHAPCDQALALHLEGVGPVESQLGPWPLGGVTKFSRTIENNNSNDNNGTMTFGKWEMEYYGNTKHMPGKYKPGIKEWSLPILSGKKVTKHASFEGF